MSDAHCVHQFYLYKLNVKQKKAPEGAFWLLGNKVTNPVAIKPPLQSYRHLQLF
jgi:hypothetical protein